MVNYINGNALKQCFLLSHNSHGGLVKMQILVQSVWGEA